VIGECAGVRPRGEFHGDQAILHGVAHEIDLGVRDALRGLEPLDPEFEFFVPFLAQDRAVKRPVSAGLARTPGWVISASQAGRRGPMRSHFPPSLAQSPHLANDASIHIHIWPARIRRS